MRTTMMVIVLFLAIMTIPVYLLYQQKVQTIKTAEGTFALQQAKLLQMKSAISILNASYEKYPDYNTTLYVKNIGSFPLELDDIAVYFNGTRVPRENTTVKILVDIRNPGLWDPGEIIQVKTFFRLKAPATYMLTVTGTYAVKTTVPFDTRLAINIYRVQPNPVDPIENVSFMEVAIVFYNPNDKPLDVWNVTDSWDLPGVINTSNYACSPNPCTADIANNRMLWSGTYTIPNESYQIFQYRININTTFMNNKANVTTLAWGDDGVVYQRTIKNIVFTSNAGTAFAEIAAGSFTSAPAIGKINGTYNVSYTMTIKETGNVTPIKAGQTVLITIPSFLLGFGSTNPLVTTNATHIMYPLQNDLLNSSESFDFWAILPDFHMPVLFNSTLQGTDDAGNVHKDIFEILVTSEGEPPVIGEPHVNDTLIYKDQVANLSQSINDTSGVHAVTFYLNGKPYTPYHTDDIYWLNFSCTRAGIYSWNMTIASDVRGYTATRNITGINITCDIVPEVEFYREQPQGCAPGKNISVRFIIFNTNKPWNVVDNFTIVDDYPDGWTITIMPSDAFVQNGKIYLHLPGIPVYTINSTNYTIMCGNEGWYNFSAYINFTYAVGWNRSNATGDPFLLEVNKSKPFFDSELFLVNGTTEKTFLKRTLSQAQYANLTITPVGNQGANELPLHYLWEYDEQYFTISDLSDPACSVVAYQGHKAINCTLYFPKNASYSFTFLVTPQQQGFNVTNASLQMSP